MAADEVIGTVSGLAKLGVVDALVWDGAPSHRDDVVPGLGLPLIGLLPYSPELDLAERDFKEVRGLFHDGAWGHGPHPAACVQHLAPPSQGAEGRQPDTLLLKWNTNAGDRGHVLPEPGREGRRRRTPPRRIGGRLRTRPLPRQLGLDQGRHRPSLNRPGGMNRPD